MHCVQLQQLPIRPSLLTSVLALYLRTSEGSLASTASFLSSLKSNIIQIREIG
uniref:Uncharacterized protein n=1 Tax=Arundo donax TaxID=35708 RepID=A0A0A9B4X0_ARUDO